MAVVAAMTLSGVRVLVTGGTGGLGLAMAEALAEAGARVAVTSRDQRRALTAAAHLGAEARGFELDLRDVASVSAAVERVDELFGGLDVLVNNAGIGMRTVNPRFFTTHSRSGKYRSPASRTCWRLRRPARSRWPGRSCRGCSVTAGGGS